MVSYISDHKGFGRFGYYPFGMVIEERFNSYERYRFGFNGKEADSYDLGDKVRYDYGFRVFDARLGRFMSVDPLFRSFPWYSSYQFSGNMPISSIDLDGLEQYVIVHWTDNGQYMGTTLFFLPNSGTVRLYRRGPLSEQTMIVHSEWDTEQYNLYRQNIFKRNTNGDIESLTEEANNLFFDVAPGTRRKRTDAVLTDGTPNRAEKEMLLSSKREFILSRGRRIKNYALEPTARYVYFDFDISNKVKDQVSEETITRYKNFLEGNPEYVIEIIGHTDSKGSRDYNERLGRERARQMKRFLVRNGIDANRIVISTKGEDDPVVPNTNPDGSDNPEWRALNRRAELQWQPASTNSRDSSD